MGKQAAATAEKAKAGDKTPRERFKELAPKRVRGILSALRVLGHCASRASYEYTDDEVEKIFAAIDQGVQELKTKFKSVAPERTQFEL